MANSCTIKPVLHVLTLILFQDSQYKFKFKNVTYTNYNEHLGSVNFTMYENNSYAIQGFMDIKGLMRNLYMKIEIYYMKMNSKKRDIFYSALVDFCELLENTKTNTILGIIFDDIREKNPHFYRKCPLEQVKPFIFEIKSKFYNCFCYCRRSFN